MDRVRLELEIRQELGQLRRLADAARDLYAMAAPNPAP